MDNFKISLAAARVNAEFSQNELAEKMGVSRSTIINWESGKTKIGTAQLHYFCEICGVPENHILLPIV